MRVLPVKLTVIATDNDYSAPQKQIDISEGQIKHIDFQMPSKERLHLASGLGDNGIS
jgi:hypothetical protein